jgi:hypothetical protein
MVGRAMGLGTAVARAFYFSYHPDISHLLYFQPISQQVHPSPRLSLHVLLSPTPTVVHSLKSPLLSLQAQKATKPIPAQQATTVLLGYPVPGPAQQGPLEATVMPRQQESAGHALKARSVPCLAKQVASPAEVLPSLPLVSPRPTRAHSGLSPSSVPEVQESMK